MQRQAFYEIYIWIANKIINTIDTVLWRINIIGYSTNINPSIPKTKDNIVNTIIKINFKSKLFLYRKTWIKANTKNNVEANLWTMIPVIGTMIVRIKLIANK